MRVGVDRKAKGRLFETVAGEGTRFDGGMGMAVDEIVNSQIGSDGKPITFAHDSEREFAGILDFYQIKWHYEPHTFPLQWDSEGKITDAFTPDFYLPELDLYVELTTLKQSLVTKKNRKLRRLRELYPDVNIKLFYGRDYRSLMTKYGLNPRLNDGGDPGRASA